MEENKTITKEVIKISVLNNLRSLSQMEFYKNAIRMRVNLTEWLLRDFGTKRKIRCINNVIKNINDEDRKTIDSIFEKYNKTQGVQFQSEYPEWFVESERTVIMRILQELIENITTANSIFPSNDFLHEEYAMRRKYQDEAISNCYNLYQELQYISSCFNSDLNKFIPFLEAVEKEVNLLKGWRQSDNKTRKERKNKLENQRKE